MRPSSQKAKQSERRLLDVLAGLGACWLAWALELVGWLGHILVMWDSWLWVSNWLIGRSGRTNARAHVGAHLCRLRWLDQALLRWLDQVIGPATMTAPGHPDVSTAARWFLCHRTVAYTNGMIFQAHDLHNVGALVAFA